MYEDIVKNAQTNFGAMLGSNEEDIKVQVVVPFLNDLGYNKDWLKYEYPSTTDGCKRRIVDISIYINRNEDNLLFTEVKKKDYKITEADCSQLANYMNDKNIEYGILTNGSLYILLCNSINGSSSQKEVLRYYLYPPKSEDRDINYSKYRNKNNLKYFSYKYLFKKKVTNYFKYLKEFRNNFVNPQSFRQYESVLYNFFDYLSEQDYGFDLNCINPNFFKVYLINSIENKKEENASRYMKSIETAISKYSYIRSFYSAILEKDAKVNPFKNITEEDLKYDISLKINKKQRVNNLEPLTIQETNLILDSYGKTYKAMRNKIIFLLFLLTGLDNNQILDLKINELKGNEIHVNKTIIPIPSKLRTLINEYISERKKKNIKCDYLVCGKYHGVYSKLYPSVFYNVISKHINNLSSITKERREIITPKFIKWSLIKKMFNEGYHLEDIICLTGLSLNAVNEYITYEDITSKVDLSTFIKNHPYKEVFSKL